MNWQRAAACTGTATCVEIAWRKATASSQGMNCVEVGYSPPGPVMAATILIRDSKNPDGPVLEFTADEWAAFLTGARNGEFDNPESCDTPLQERQTQ